MDSKKHSNFNSKKKKDPSKNKSNFICNLLTKKNILYSILLLIDIILIIYMAKHNAVNYVKISGQSIFVSKTRYLLLGRNYITLVVIMFFYG